MNFTRNLRLYLILSRPYFLLGGLLFYALGVGVAHYLGMVIDWGMYLIGQAWVTTLQLSAHFLNEYFDAPADQENSNRTTFSGGSGAIGDERLPRRSALLASATTLTLTSSLTVVLIRSIHLSPLLILIFIISVLVAIFYSVPPIRLVTTGYGELVTSILVAALIPLFSFVLQNGEPHRILLGSTLPLTALHLSMMLVFEFPDYATDLKHNKNTLLVRLGWQRGIMLHNLLVLSAFLLLGIAMMTVLPYSVAFPTFLSFPIGLLQIWQMRQIVSGVKPNWKGVTALSVTLLSSTTYFMAFSFWFK